MRIEGAASIPDVDDNLRISAIDWLAGVFMAPPTAEVARAYLSSQGKELLDAIGHELGCDTGIARMQTALTDDVSAVSFPGDLSSTYTRLFDGVAGPATVPIYESAYTGNRERLFQQPTSDMNRWLQRFSLSIDPDCREPSDHVSIELALLSIGLRQRDSFGAAQLRERLLGWIPEFGRRCCNADRTGFYAGAAIVMNTLLASPNFAVGTVPNEFV
jgi:TorA-specific chaperone